MADQLEAALQTVKDPESGYPIARLGVIERFRFSDQNKTLYIFSDFLSHQPNCMACVGIASTIITTIKRQLTEELQSRFPDLTIEWV